MSIVYSVGMVCMHHILGRMRIRKTIINIRHRTIDSLGISMAAKQVSDRSNIPHRFHARGNGNAAVKICKRQQKKITTYLRINKAKCTN